MNPPKWIDDISIITTQVLTTTGGTVWDAARRCAQYLETEATSVGLERPGVKVLELGAGCGLLGMLVARNTPAAAEVCLTEQAYGGALDHLRKNVESNQHLQNMASVTVRACDWTHLLNEQLVQAVRLGCSSADGGRFQQQQQQQQQEQPSAACSTSANGNSTSDLAPAELDDLQKLLTTQWDIIIGSDLVYNTAGVKGLPRVLAALIPHPCSSSSSSSQAPQPVMYYAHTKHRFDAMDVDLFAELGALGLSVEEVIEHGEELPPPSPPPFSSLYPDLRIAVFKISRHPS